MIPVFKPLVFRVGTVSGRDSGILYINPVAQATHLYLSLPLPPNWKSSNVPHKTNQRSREGSILDEQRRRLSIGPLRTSVCRRRLVNNVPQPRRRWLTVPISDTVSGETGIPRGAVMKFDDQFGHIKIIVQEISSHLECRAPLKPTDSLPPQVGPEEGGIYRMRMPESGRILISPSIAYVMCRK